MASSVSFEKKHSDEQDRTAKYMWDEFSEDSTLQGPIVSENCTFCEILHNTKENKTFIAKLNYGSLFLHWDQCYAGRCLYISNTHVENYPHIDYNLFINLNTELLLLCKMIKKAFQPDRINYASLGNVVKHFHYHIIPRYKDDPNWGGPPWPSVEKKLTRIEYENLVNIYRSSLGECEWWKR